MFRWYPDKKIPTKNVLKNIQTQINFSYSYFNE